jgi:hypothetical protein
MIDRKLLSEYCMITNQISNFNIYENFTCKSKNDDFLMIEMIIANMEKFDELKKLYDDLNDFISKVNSEDRNFYLSYKNERRRFRLFMKKAYKHNKPTVKLFDNLSYLIQDENIFLQKIKFFINHLETYYKSKLN